MSAGGSTMKYEPPMFEEIEMNAEVGSYEDDFGRDESPLVEDEED